MGAFKTLLFKNSPLAAVAGELACLFVFAAMMLALVTALFRRTP